MVLGAQAGADGGVVEDGDVGGDQRDDVAVLNHPTIGPRLRAQNQQLRALLTTADTSVAARLRAEAALGGIWRPLIAEPPLDLTDPAHQQILIDAAVAALQPSRSLPNGGPASADHIGSHASART